jgi:hypothetical protein
MNFAACETECYTPRGIRYPISQAVAGAAADTVASKAGQVSRTRSRTWLRGRVRSRLEADRSCGTPATSAPNGAGSPRGHNVSAIEGHDTHVPQALTVQANCGPKG